MTLCISQFQLRPTQPPPTPLGYCRAFACLVSPEGGAFANFVLPERPGICQPRSHSRAFNTHAVFDQNITTQDFIGTESRLAYLSRTGKN